MQITKNIKPEFIDTRGAITNILPKGASIKSVLLITSKAGAIRSNHYHKSDSHYCYILSGNVQWSEKSIGCSNVDTEILNSGDMIYTPAMMIHAVKFLEDTTFLAFAVQPRDQDSYEEDTVKAQLI